MNKLVGPSPTYGLGPLGFPGILLYKYMRINIIAYGFYHYLTIPTYTRSFSKERNCIKFLYINIIFALNKYNSPNTNYTNEMT